VTGLATRRAVSGIRTGAEILELDHLFVDNEKIW
jgi:hypothetical protein